MVNDHKPNVAMLHAVYAWYQETGSIQRLCTYFACEIMLNDFYTGRTK